MRAGFVLIIMAICTTGNSQTVIDVDKSQGVGLANRIFFAESGYYGSRVKYTRLTSGSPYFDEDWLLGAVETDSSRYDNLRLKLDLLENVVVYLSSNNEEMVSRGPIQKVVLIDTIAGKTYLFVHAPEIPGRAADRIWYRQLTVGKTSLYKQYAKRMYETKPYGSSITEQSVETEERYFILSGGAFTRVKKLKDVVDFLPSKDQQQVNDYIQKGKLSGKKESDYISTVEFANTLNE